MAQRKDPWTLGEIAERTGATLCGPKDLAISRPAPASRATRDSITFAEKEKFLTDQAAAIIVWPDAPELAIPHLRHPQPRICFYHVLALFDQPMTPPVGVHLTAVIHPTARVHESACIGPYVVVHEDAEVNEGAILHEHVTVGPRCRVDKGCELMPGVRLVRDVTIHANCLLHENCVIGADGFGFIFDGTNQRKIPQVGGVVIHEDVEIGACTCIDRATSGNTVIGRGTKLDNLVQIGHNCQIGEHCVIAAQTGIAGSTIVGNRVMMGGQVAVKDNVTICEGAILGGGTWVFQNIEEPGNYWGAPMTDMKQALRLMALYKRLPELEKRLKALEDNS